MSVFLLSFSSGLVKVDRPRCRHASILPSVPMDVNFLRTCRGWRGHGTEVPDIQENPWGTVSMDASRSQSLIDYWSLQTRPLTLTLTLTQQKGPDLKKKMPMGRTIPFFWTCKSRNLNVLKRCTFTCFLHFYSFKNKTQKRAETMHLFNLRRSLSVWFLQWPSG